MLALLQTIHDHVYESEITQCLDCIKAAIPPEQLSLPVAIVGCTKAGKVVITETLADVLSATDVGLISERTFLLCALHKLPEDVLQNVADALIRSQRVSARTYERYVNYPLSRIASERHIMSMAALAAFPKKDQLGKYLVNRLLTSGLLLTKEVDELVRLAVNNPIAYWVPAVGRILLQDTENGYNAYFQCTIHAEESEDFSGWPPLGWPL